MVAGRAFAARELMALGSIYASQAGRKVMDREARDLAVASSSGGSKVRRHVPASPGGGSKVRSGRVSELWRRQQALEEVARFHVVSKL